VKHNSEELLDLVGKEKDCSSCFSFRSLGELSDTVIYFYRKLLDENDASEFVERRKRLAKYIRNFHRKGGTLTSEVEAAIGNLEEDSCLVLMTAHQPNLFAYSGVFRKATLTYVLAKKLSESLKVPVVSFFGVADQDFADDRWVKSALLPDVERRDGTVELRFDMPEKLMINRIEKPSKKVLDNWQNEIKSWIIRQTSTVERECRVFNLEFDRKKTDLFRNFEAFGELFQKAYEHSETYADFNAFVTSRIVNEAWGYDTLFSRFSDCQQIFEKEFCFLLSKFEDYSSCLKEILDTSNLEKGVFGQEYKTIPFWYHCSCGSKARLTAEQKGASVIGRGSCLRCGKEYLIDFHSKNDIKISEFASQISARSLSMPLIFFPGLGVSCYVGGVGGIEYLTQSKYVAERLKLIFPPVVVWRPKDIYNGVGQLSAIITFKRLSGTSDLNQYLEVEAEFNNKITEVEKNLQDLELQKQNLIAGYKIVKEERIQGMKDLVRKQNELRRTTDYPVLMRNHKLLENVAAVVNLHPCIVDYAVNIGLKQTSEQWITFLERNNNLSSDITLITGFDEVRRCIESS
jgi:hypothetical protein